MPAPELDGLHVDEAVGAFTHSELNTAVFMRGADP